jgi:hypothetical protein
MQQDDDDDWLARLQKKFTSSPPPTPEQIAEYAAERQAEENTKLIWAHLAEDAKIAVRISLKGEKGAHGSSEFVISPDQESYGNCLSEYELKLPGDTRCIKERWINGEWVVETSYIINNKEA